MKADKETDTVVGDGIAHGHIQYETILSTLVQNKISAIKRDCETKRLKKQKRRDINCLSSLIFGKRTDGHQRNRTDDNQCIINEANCVAISTTTIPANSNVRPSSIGLQLHHLAADGTAMDRKRICDSDDVVGVSVAVNSRLDDSRATTKTSIECDINVLNGQQGTDKEMYDDGHPMYEQEQEQEHRQRHQSQLLDTSTTAFIDDDDDDDNDVNDATMVIENAYYQHRSLTSSLAGDGSIGEPISDNNTIKTSAECDVELSAVRATNSKHSSVISHVDEDVVDGHIRASSSSPLPHAGSPDANSISSHRQTIHSSPSEVITEHDSAVIRSAATSISAQCSPLFTQRKMAQSRHHLQYKEQQQQQQQHDGDDNDSIKYSNETDEPNSNAKVASKLFFKRKHDATETPDNCTASQSQMQSQTQLTANKLPTVATIQIDALAIAHDASADDNIEGNVDSDEDSYEQRMLAKQSMHRNAVQLNGKHKHSEYKW